MSPRPAAPLVVRLALHHRQIPTPAEIRALAYDPAFPATSDALECDGHPLHCDNHGCERDRFGEPCPFRSNP